MKDKRQERGVGRIVAITGLFVVCWSIAFLIPIGSDSIVHAQFSLPTPTGELGASASDLAEKAGSGELINPQPSTTEGFSCFSSLFHPACWFAHAGVGLLTLTGWMLWFAGVILNQAIVVGVVEMGTVVKGLNGVETAWIVLRDLANIFFIFGLVAIGIMTILEIQGYNAKSLLARLIVVALLINFSLFFTQVIIDASNILAVGIYNKAAQETGLATCTSRNIDTESFNINDISEQCSSDGLADQFMNSLRINTIFKSKVEGPGIVNPRNQSLLDSDWDIFLATVMGSLFVLITAFVFIAAAVLLLIRFLVLVILMILSPLAFLAMAIPKLGGQASKWWRTLFSQAFFAPAFFIMILVVLKIIGDEGFLTGEQDFVAAIGGVQGAVLIMINFIIIIGLIIASLVIARQMGAVGATTAINIGHGIRRGAQGVIGRNTVGVAAQGAGEAYEWANAKLGRTRAGRNVRRAISTLSLGALSDKSIRGVVDAGKKAKFGSGTSREEEVKASRQRQREVAAKQREIETQKSAQRVAGARFAGAPTPEDTARIGSMSIKDLEKVPTSRLATPSVAQLLSGDQLEAIAKSDEFTPQQAEQIRQARFAPVLDAVAQGNAQPLRGLSEKEVEMLGNDLQRDTVVRNLTQSQVDAIRKSSKINSSTKRHIIDQRIAYLQDVVNGRIPNRTIGDEIRTMTPQNIAKLDASILTHPETARYYTPTILMELAKELNVGDRQTIRHRIVDAVQRRQASPQQQRSYKWLTRSGTPLGDIF